MRQICLVMLAGFAVSVLAAGPVAAEKVEVKGPHICCKQCVNVVNGLLGKVDGVSDVVPDPKTKTVSFTATDEKAAKAGIKALIDGGFFGSATCDGKEAKIDVPAVKKGDKAEKVAVKNVHVCCGQCQTAIKKIFKDATVTFTDPKGPQRTVTIEGADLYRGEVIDALKKAGFYGSVEK